MTPHLSPLPPADLARAERLAAETGEAVEIVCLRLGRLSEDDLATAQSDALGLDRAGAVDFPDTPLFADAPTPEFLRAGRRAPEPRAGRPCHLGRWRAIG